MNIFMFYLEGEKAKAGAVRSLFNKKDFTFKTLNFVSPDESGRSYEVQFASCFSIVASRYEDLRQEFIPSHILILSKFPKSCFDFLAGYSCASANPFPVFGEDAISGIPNAFSHSFLPIKTDEDLIRYFKAQKEAYIKSEYERESEKARSTLLKLGISVNVESLVKCAAEGHIHEMSLFLASGFSPDTLSSDGIPLLSIAARKGNREALRLLIHSGAQLNLLSYDRGSSALIDSVMGKHKTIAKDLIKAGADVNICSKDGQSALIIAVGAGDEATVEHLLNAGANPDVTDNLGVSARKYATLFHNKTILGFFEALPPPIEEFKG